MPTCGRLVIGLPRARPNAPARSRLAAMWGRLPTCGRLVIGLPQARPNAPARSRLAAMWGTIENLAVTTTKHATWPPVATSTCAWRKPTRIFSSPSVARQGWHPARRLAIAALRVWTKAAKGGAQGAPPIRRRLTTCPTRWAGSEYIFITFGGPQGHDDRLSTCGRLVIGLPQARPNAAARSRLFRHVPQVVSETSVCGSAAMWGSPSYLPPARTQ